MSDDHRDGGQENPGRSPAPIGDSNAGLPEELADQTPGMQEILRICMTKGPLPPPAILEEYERILPGAAERIFSRADEEAEHRRAMDRRAFETAWEDQQAERRERRVGQILGFCICMALIIAGVFIAGLTQTAAGTIVGGLVGAGGLAPVIVAFMTGRDTAGKDESPPEA